MNFEVEGKELDDSQAWMKKQKLEHPHPGTTIGGRFSYKFTPTGLGIAVHVIDNLTGDEEDVTDVGSW
jgi:hypothetical protein